ncbi:MAG: hypothetical protein IJL20_10640 [Lachnospiraceae bacterium]|nr:hypothetical protein [Lachnospiraceae bacterium]
MNKRIEKLQDYSVYFDFFDRNGINSKIFPQEFFPIIALFAEDCRYKLKECYLHMSRLFISGGYKGKTCSLMLRINPGEEYGLVIASVQFVHQRKGYFTRLVAILEDIRKANSLGAVMIESVISPKMKNWVKKYGWIEMIPKSGNYISKETIKRAYKKIGITWKESMLKLHM